jgi:pimeloyl-ACP methyl ester carboxylesterase
MSTVHARAVRLDSEHGTREVFTFFGPHQELLAGTTYLPSSSTRSGVLICAPICSDYITNYRREVLLARTLAAHGIAVQRFDYRGTGNSDSEQALMSFQTMCEDAQAAADHLCTTAGLSQVSFIGTRIGGIVAATIASQRSEAVLVLIEPTLDPTLFFREGFRVQMLHHLSQGSGGSGGDILLAELELSGTMDILGYSVSKRLYDSLRVLDLKSQLPRDGRPLLLLQLGDRTRIRPDYQSLILACRREGTDIEIATEQVAVAGWISDDDGPPIEGLSGQVSEWLIRHTSP